MYTFTLLPDFFGAQTSRALRAQLMHALLLSYEISLLRANNTAWSANAQPSDGFAGCKVVVLHDVHGNKCACAAQPSEAMH